VSILSHSPKASRGTTGVLRGRPPTME
jgi:hypothetical protein